MGRFIDINQLPADNFWIIPKELLQYDRRFTPEPWPNPLFPWFCDLHWGNDWWSLESKILMVKFRRFVEQKCEGDVARHRRPEHSLHDIRQDRIWFEHEGDQVLTKLVWEEYLVK